MGRPSSPKSWFGEEIHRGVAIDFKESDANGDETDAEISKSPAMGDREMNTLGDVAFGLRAEGDVSSWKVVGSKMPSGVADEEMLRAVAQAKPEACAGDGDSIDGIPDDAGDAEILSLDVATSAPDDAAQRSRLSRVMSLRRRATDALSRASGAEDAVSSVPKEGEEEDDEGCGGGKHIKT